MQYSQISIKLQIKTLHENSEKIKLE